MRFKRKTPRINLLGPAYYKKPNLILLVSGIIYFVILVYGLIYPKPIWYLPVYWCVQSALIGSVADWFAIQALFRRPLGIKFHTAIVPRKKMVLVNKITEFVEVHLLSKERMTKLIDDIDWYNLLNKGIMSKQGQLILQSLISTLLLKLVNENNKELLISKIKEFLPNIPVEEYIYQWLWKNDGNKINTYYHNILNVLINIIKGESFKYFIVLKIEEYIAKKSWLERTFIQNAIDKNELSEVFQDQCLEFLQKAAIAGNEEYKFLYSYWENFCKSFAKDGQGRLVCRKMYSEWVQSLPIEKIIADEIFIKIDKYLALNERGISVAGSIVTQELQSIWKNHSKQEVFKTVINKSMADLGKALLLAFHDIIGKIVNSVLKSFDDKMFNKFIEDKVGYDLGWIRINGAIVGAITGLLVWLFLEGLYMPIIVPWLKGLFII